MFSKIGSGLRVLLGCLSLVLAAAAMAQPQVLTYHNDNLRTGLNASETILSPTTVNSSKFGLLFSLPVDGQVYAQPLYMPRLSIPGKGTHNVVFIATEHNSVYAFDADNNTGTNANPLWHVNFGASIPNGDVGSDDINPEIGISSTPVIHTMPNGATGLYVESKTKSYDKQNNAIYTHKLPVLSVATGAELLKGPFVISGQVPGTGEGSSNGVVPFNPLIQHCRPGLLVVPPGGGVSTNNLYVCFASHGDNGPYHGWVFVYNADTMKLLKILNTTPNAVNNEFGPGLAAGGIWQGGFGPASDGTSVFFSTGNGQFSTSNQSYGDSILRILNKTLSIADYFAPADQLNLNDYDEDLGSGGIMLIPTTANGTSKINLAVQCGKEGSIYLLNTANLGKNNSTNKIVQELTGVMGGIWGGPAYFNKRIYYGPTFGSIAAFGLNNGLFTKTTAIDQTQTGYGQYGPTPSVSASGTKNGIVWAIQADAYGSGGPSILHAYDALNLGSELYNSSMVPGRDVLGGAVKFTTPTIVNGKVYVGCSGSVGVFGLGNWAATPKISPASGTYTGTVTVTMTDSTLKSQIRYTTDGTTPTATSTLYTKPLSLTSSVTLKARAFATNMSPSSTVEADYLINPVIGTGVGLYGQYFDGVQDPSGTPTATQVDPVINFTWNGNSPIAGVGGSNWAGMWTGQIQAMTTGTYTLTTNSDDGVQVYINGVLKINHYDYHAPSLDSVQVDFSAGVSYDIVIKFFQGGGGSVLQLFWSAPGLPMQIVPQTQLYPGK